MYWSQQLGSRTNDFFHFKGFVAQNEARWQRIFAVIWRVCFPWLASTLKLSYPWSKMVSVLCFRGHGLFSLTFPWWGFVLAVPVWGDWSRGKTVIEDTDTRISAEPRYCLQIQSFWVALLCSGSRCLARLQYWRWFCKTSLALLRGLVIGDNLVRPALRD